MKKIANVGEFYSMRLTGQKLAVFNLKPQVKMYDFR